MKIKLNLAKKTKFVLPVLGWLVCSLAIGGCGNDATPTSSSVANTPSTTDLAGPVSTSALPPTAPVQNLVLPGGPVGINLYLYRQSDKVINQTLEWLKDLNINWVRLPLYWNHFEPNKGQRKWEEVDQAIKVLHEAGIRVMLNPIHTPAWAAITPQRPGLPRNAADFADFLKEAVNRYKGRVAAYEIWNEPNLEREAGKPIRAGAYVELLKAGYKAVKEADPAALVVTAGLTPTGYNDPNVAIDDVAFLRQFYTYNGGEAKKYYDVLGAHPGSSHNPPDTLWPAQPGPGPGWRDHPSFYFRRIEQIRQVMVENGESAKPVWLTEFGWASTPRPAEGFGFAAQVSEEQQAQYLARALSRSRSEYRWVGQMFIFQLNMALPEFTADPADERIAWGLIRRDGSRRPAYFAVQNFIRQNP